MCGNQRFLVTLDQKDLPMEIENELDQIKDYIVTRIASLDSEKNQKIREGLWGAVMNPLDMVSQ